MAEDQVQLMEQLGFYQFYLVSHDRGARTAHRLCIDYPDRVIKVAFLDIVPTLHMFETMTMREALGYHHWLSLAQPYDYVEKLILAGQNGIRPSISPVDNIPHDDPVDTAENAEAEVASEVSERDERREAEGKRVEVVAWIGNAGVCII
ncbi:hypothetical protein HDU93_002785 [Gonapodya sp. JEL0774]|nr:hypothetical protein HDU93_002785 [Gonapodya sp. JEL0774]